MNTPHDPPTTPSGPTGRVPRLVRKELSEILRDRRTVMTLVLMPLLLYPLLSIAFQQFLLASDLDRRASERIRIGFATAEEQKQFYGLFELLSRLAAGRPGGKALAERLAAQALPPSEVSSQAVAKLHGAQIDLVVRARPAGDGREWRLRGATPDGQELDLRLPRDWDLLYLPDSPQSIRALQVLQDKLGLVNAVFRSENGEPLPRPDRAGAIPLGVRAEPQERERAQPYFPVATLVPLILILMTITGAVYPAIDLTAGERERGTLEILVAAPVPRMELLFAKYVSVVAVAVLTALVNLTMMTVTVQVSGLGTMFFGAGGLSLPQLAEVFGLLLLFAIFFSGVLLTITSFARSFKEAQAYLIPLMLASLAPGVAGMIPGLRLTPSLALVPLLNIVLLSRDLLEQTASPLYALLVVGSTLLYAALALTFAARVFGAEDVLYSDQTGWSDLLRRPRVARPAPSLAGALLCLSLIFFLSFIVNGVIGASQAILPGAKVLWLALLSVPIFAGVPLAVGLWRRVTLADGFRLRPPGLAATAGAVLLGAGVWPFLLLLLQGLHHLHFFEVNEAVREQLQTSAGQIRRTTPVWLIVAGRVLPALAEELFFRGYLFSALRKVTGPLATVAVSAVLFGLLHMVITPGLGPQRFVASTLLGLILGWVCWRGGGVIPAMLLHAVHNALSVLLEGRYGGEAFLPAYWYAAGAVGVAAGVTLVWSGGRDSLPARDSAAGACPG